MVNCCDRSDITCDGMSDSPPPPLQKQLPAMVGGRSVLELGILHARKMFWYKLQGYVKYIVQYLCKTDLEDMIVNSIKQVCTGKMDAHYAVMVQPQVNVNRWQVCQM